MIEPISQELSALVDSLLAAGNGKEARRILEEEDEKQLTYARNAMIQKMPKELHPQPGNRTASVSPPSRLFPSMFEQSNKKTYEYINENIENMRLVSSNYSQVPKSKGLNVPPKEFQEDAVLPEGQSQAIKQASVKGSLKENDQSVHSFISRPPMKNPFVANNKNFTDQFANSKSIPQKYQHLNFTEQARNMVAIAQGAKFSAFSESVAYPTTVMAGTMLPPRQSTFSKDTKFDVQDVMRYTLGAKRSSSRPQMQNPFMRAPKRRQ